MIPNETSPLIVDASSNLEGDSPAPLPAEESLIQRMGLGRKRATLVIFTAIALMGVATRYVVPSLAISQRSIKVTKYADWWSKKYLDKPTLFSERFYNSTKKEQQRMRYLPLRGKMLPAPEKPPPIGCQTTVVLLRHCEKGTPREHCTNQGFERSGYIATLFGNDPETRWPAPSHIFGTNPSRHTKGVRNYREEETMEPLSKKFGINVDTTYGSDQIDELAEHIFDLLRSGKVCGEVMLVSWKHSQIGKIAQHLGCGPQKGCPKKYGGGKSGASEFDDIWQISYIYDKPKYPKFAPGMSKNWMKPWGKYPVWSIWGTVQKEGFDPLKFAKKEGAYHKVPTNNNK